MNKVEPHYVLVQGPLLFAKVSFARIDPADQKLPGEKKGMLNSLSLPPASHISLVWSKMLHIYLEVSLSYLEVKSYFVDLLLRQ